MCPCSRGLGPPRAEPRCRLLCDSGLPHLRGPPRLPIIVGRGSHGPRRVALPSRVDPYAAIDPTTAWGTHDADEWPAGCAASTMPAVPDGMWPGDALSRHTIGGTARWPADPF